MRANKSAQRYKVALDVALANTKKLFDAGVSIASGTDTGPPARFQGYFEHMELDLLAKAGLKPADIIAAATGNGGALLEADRCRVPAAGTVGGLSRAREQSARGHRADQDARGGLHRGENCHADVSAMCPEPPE